MSLHALVEKWREAAKSERLIAITTPGIDKYACQVQARIMEKFADELESALAGGGEAVAWIDSLELHDLQNGKQKAVVFCASHDGDDVPLYLHPAGAVQVTDEMTKRAEDYFYDNSPFTGPDELRGGLRGCLNAALNPGGSRDHD